MIVLLFVQIMLVPVVALDNVVPDLLIILVVFYTIKYGQVYGMLLGFATGLVFDLTTGVVLGSSMFAKTISAFIAGYFYNVNKTENFLKSYRFALLLLFTSLLHNTSQTLLSGFELQTNFLTLFLTRGLLPALYTAAIGGILVFFYPRRGFDD